MTLPRADQERFAEWVRKATPLVLSSIRRFGGSAADAEDILQDTLIGVLPHLPKIESFEAFVSFVRMRSRWRSFDVWRSRRLGGVSRTESLALHPEAMERVDVGDPESNLRQKQLWEAVQKLPLRSRQVVERAAQGMSSMEIAREMNIAPASVRSLLRHARHRLASSEDE
jgi:RNA polymerase sigma factor (sigma-70 family)